MKPSLALNQHRAEIRALMPRFHVINPRIFGSVLHGEDHQGSDLDVLVDALPNTTLFDLGGLQVALEALLGVSVDVVTPNDLPEKFRQSVLNEARCISLCALRPNGAHGTPY